MVTINKVYTKTGDKGRTRLANGDEVSKWSPRVNTYGTVDELNAILGMCTIQASETVFAMGDKTIHDALLRIQNDLFDLGADIATPMGEADDSSTRLRILPSQVERLETEIDAMNEDIPPLDSFVLPGGTPLAAYLHHARTVARRAERQIVALNEYEDAAVSDVALIYMNRLSDWLFVASRRANSNGAKDVKWVPGANR